MQQLKTLSSSIDALMYLIISNKYVMGAPPVRWDLRVLFELWIVLNTAGGLSEVS